MATGALRVASSLKAMDRMPVPLRLIIRYTGWILLAFVLLIFALPGEPLFDSKVYWWLGAYLVYQSTVSFLGRKKSRLYETSWLRMIRIQTNIAFMSSLVYITSGAQSYFWFAYLLPLFSTIVYFDNSITALFIFGEIEFFYSLICFNILGSTRRASWPLFIVNSGVLLVLLGVLYYLVGSLRIRQAIGMLGAFQETRNEIDQTYDVKSLKEVILKRAVRAVGAKSGSLMLVDHHTNSLVADTFIGHGRTREVREIRRFDIDGQGIAAWVAREKRPFRTGDASKEQHFRPTQKGQDIVSLLSVPIMARGRLLGVINVDHEERDFFDEGDERLLWALAMDVANALERAQLQSSLQRVFGALGSTPELDRVGGVILDELGKIIEYRNASIQLVRGDFRQLVAYRGFDESAIDRRLLRPISQDRLVKRIAAHKEPLILREPSKDPDWELRPETADVKSWVGIPLVYGERMMGLLTLDHDQPGYYTEVIKDLLILFGSQAAIALKNWESLEELRDLYQTSLEITRELDLQVLLESIVQRAVELLHARGGGFYECDYEREQVRLSVVHNITDEIIGQTLRFGEGMAGLVVLEGEPNTVDNYQKWPGAAKVYTEGRWKDLFEAVVEAPVKWQERVIGVLFVIDKKRHFMKDEIHLLERFANQAAIAINNATILKRLGDIVDTSFDGIIQVDENGRITQFNPSAEKLLGYKAAEVLGTYAYKLYCRGHQEAREIQTLLEEDEIVRNRPSCVVHKSGRPVDILFSGALLRDQAGRHIGSVGFFEDMTGVQALRVISNASRTAFEAIRRMSQPEELQDLLDTIVKEAGELFNADAASILLREDNKLVDKAYGGYTQEEIESVSIPVGGGLVGLAMNEGRPVVLPDVRKEPRYIMVSPDVRSELNVPIIGDSGPIGVLHVSSHRVGHFRPEDRYSLELAQILADFAAVAIQRAEAVRQQQETHERLLRTASAVAAGRLAAGVGHEVKGSITSVGLSIGNIADRIERIQGLPGQKELLDKIEQIHKELGHLASIATRLHRLSLEWEPEKQRVYLNEVVKHSVDLLQSTIEAHKCSSRLDLDPALDRPPQGSGGHQVLLDERQIRQVIVNMTLNALDASERGQRIDYRTRRHKEQRQVEIQIQDYGAGIDDETKRSLFKPFFTIKPGGTGLGLYVSDLVVRDKHGGRIEIDTKPGRGTVFSIFLPVK